MSPEKKKKNSTLPKTMLQAAGKKQAAGKNQGSKGLTVSEKLTEEITQTGNFHNVK